MVKELTKTPLGEFRWFKLLGDARENYDKNGYEWTCEMLLDGKDKNVIEWMDMMEQKFFQIHGENAKKSTYWFNCFPDKDDDSKLVIKFKLPRFSRKDGSFSEGPSVMDAERNQWPVSKEIGNGSKGFIAFDIFGWGGKGRTGAGMTLQPWKVMVVEHIAYEGGSMPADDEVFEKISGGFSVKEEEKIPF